MGCGYDISIKALAEAVQKAVGYEGKILWDVSKPNGTPRKLLDVSRLDMLGWKARVQLQDGIEGTVKWYLEHREEARM
jgi:GDP-L-fucose synthase